MLEIRGLAAAVLLAVFMSGCGGSTTADELVTPTTQPPEQGAGASPEPTTTFTSSVAPAETTTTTTQPAVATTAAVTTTSLKLDELPVPGDAIEQLAGLVDATLAVQRRSFSLTSTRIVDAGETETVMVRNGAFDAETQTGEGTLFNVADGEASMVETRLLLGQEHWFGNGSSNPVQWTGMSLNDALQLASHDLIGEMTGDVYLQAIRTATTAVERIGVAADGSERWFVSVEADRMIDVFAASDFFATSLRARGADDTGVTLLLTVGVERGRIKSISGDFSPWWSEAYAKLVAGSLSATSDGSEQGYLELAFSAIDGPVLVNRPCNDPVGSTANDSISVLIC